ncbi:hypothetical protein DXG01_009038 [Tephrocybe rancida]|nr:hypothetical protein DXG01_009038 [Tephrocybe rancida]
MEFAKTLDEAIEALRQEGADTAAFEKPGRAFIHEAPVEKGQSIEDMLRRIMDSPIEVSVAEFIGSSGTLREAVRKWMTKKRLPIEGSKKIMLNISDLSEIRQELNAPPLEKEFIHVNHLAEAGFSTTTEAQGTIPAGAIICGDPVLQYYESLAPDEKPKIIICANESEGLRTIYPVVNGKGGVESILDGGSQIVSMAKGDAEKAGLTWDSSITIHMQSANKQLDETCGLARNVPFSFGDLIVYLQVHVVNEPAYHVLMVKMGVKI